MKTCQKCNQEKELSGYNKNKWAPDGLCYICKVCDREKNRQYYLANKEKAKARMDAYKARDVEHYKDINNKYYERNKDKVLALQAEYRKENKTRIKVRYKQQVDVLGERYVKQLLKRQLALTTVPKEMIEAKRNLLLLKRELRTDHE